jgi:hypothetical protein
MDLMKTLEKVQELLEGLDNNTITFPTNTSKITEMYDKLLSLVENQKEQWEMVALRNKYHEAKKRWKKTVKPRVGDPIILPPGDFKYGGIFIIDNVFRRISGGKKIWFFSVEETPGCEYNWEYYNEDQDQLEKHYGQVKGRRG